MSQLQDNLNEILRQKNVYIIPANIRSGVEVLGVTGSMEPDKPDQTKTCTPTTSQQVISADTGYELTSVTVNGVTASIDANIVAGNIKKNTTILGVTGSYEGLDTSDANAIASDIAAGKTAYVNGAKITGTRVAEHDSVKLFATTTAMNNDADKVLGDIAIVYGDNEVGIADGDIITYIIIPKSFTLPTQMIGDGELFSASAVDPLSEDEFHGEVAEDYASFTYTNGADTDEVTYTSSDGIHYNTEDISETIAVDFGEPLEVTEQTPEIDYISWLTTTVPTLYGLYQVTSVNNTLTYTALPVQLSAITAGDIYQGKVVMGANNNIVTGTLEVNQAEVNTAVDTTESILGPEVEPPVGNQDDPAGEGGLEEVDEVEDGQED